MSRSRSRSLPRSRSPRRPRSSSRDRSNERQLSRRSRSRSPADRRFHRKRGRRSPHSELRRSRSLSDDEGRPRDFRDHKKQSKKSKRREEKRAKKHKRREEKLQQGEDEDIPEPTAVTDEEKAETQSPQQPADARSFFEQLKMQEAAKAPVGTIHSRGLPAPVSATAISVSDKWECSKAGCGHMNSKHAPACNKCGAMKRLTEWR